MKKAAVVSRGWIGDAIACTSAADQLSLHGYQVDFFHMWPQLQPILENQKNYRPIVYSRQLTRFLAPPWQKVTYDMVVTEPTPWSYAEPFTLEIQKLAGIERPDPKLGKIKLPLPDKEASEEPLVLVSRDIYKRSYGRDIDELIRQIEKKYSVEWIGLGPDQDSKKGVKKSLLTTAVKLSKGGLYLGPEGGILWLSCLLGCNVIYLTEHIQETKKRWPQTRDVCFDFRKISIAPFVEAAPAGCSNDHLLDLLDNIIKKSQDKSFLATS